MTTLKQLFQTFCHDPKWGRLATQSTQPMSAVFMRKLGDMDITTLTDFDIETQLSMSEQTEDSKVKARSCMHYMLRWAREQGKEVPQIAHPFEIKEQGHKTRNTKPKLTPRYACSVDVVQVEPKLTDDQKEDPKSNTPRGRRTPRTSKPRGEGEARRKRTETKVQPKASGAGTKERKKQDGRSYIKPEKKVADNHREHADALQDYNNGDNINLYDSEHPWGRPSTGTIYHDNASKGWMNGKRVFKDCWRAEITISGQRYRHRSKEREDCVAWLKAIKQGKIKPTDNKADWWRMEQRKDDNVRIDEIIVSAAEEAVLLYDYHQTGDITAINDYLVKRLLPHMVYYCAHTLHFGQDRTITASRQAAALLLTRITAGKPVMNFTSTCKRMLRLHKQRGDFFYYETAPQEVKLMVNKINFDGLAEVWKVTKDRRI